MSGTPTPPRFPSLVIVEEALREGVQIESTEITTAQKIELLDLLSASGLREIVVGSFVSPKWVPQMADVEEVVAGMRVTPGVTYSALVLNRRGAERRAALSPPLSIDPLPSLKVHACDVFVQRNTNRTQADEIASWAEIAADAAARGYTTAGIRLNAAFGSNWVGDIEPAAALGLIERMIAVWHAHGVSVTNVWLGDPMGWNTPLRVEHLLGEISGRWPSVDRVHLHLHNQRGAAIVSAYAALRTLNADKTLVVDTSIGGIGGCPYCGNGRATGMIPTEDFVDLVEEMGIRTGIDRDQLIEAARYAESIVGRRLDGKLTRCGPRPRGDALYDMDMPLIETFEESSHFLHGPSTYAHQRRPWTQPIRSWQRGRANLSARDGEQ